jgi:DNA-binding transcriptional MerR regulator
MPAHRKDRMFGIGEFSKITGLTVKTLRFYHDEGLLVPSFIDPQTGYRHYETSQIESARTIAYLRSLEFSLADIKSILDVEGDTDVLTLLENHKASIAQRIRSLCKAIRSLDQFISEERQAQAMTQSDFQVQEKLLEAILIAGIRMKGRYSDCGKAFAKLGRSLGRHISGKPFLLHYDSEYREDDADFEACMPLRRQVNVDGISVRSLPAGRCISLLHRGPYDQLSHSYAKILSYAKAKRFEILSPTREIYLKGPGMIFKGNPKNYLTEIQLPIQSPTS